MRTSTPPRRASVRFDAPSPRRSDELPRMDVAAFVGFAASGPLHVAVAVESPVEFEELFGRDLPIGLDADGRNAVVAQLAPSVRSFFANGGRRCHVVRVAFDEGPHRAAVSRFPLRGLVAVEGDDSLSPRTVTVDARSEGSWADDALVTTSLTAEALATTASTDFVARHGDDRPWLALAAPQSLAVGDLVRLTARDDAQGWCFVDAVRPVAGATDRTEWRRGRALWFTELPSPDNAPPGFTRATWRDDALTPDEPREREVTLAARGGPTVARHGDDALVETLDPAAAALRPGTLVELRGATPRWWLFVTDLSPAAWTLAGDVSDRADAPLAGTDANEVRWFDPATPDRDVRVAVGGPTAGTPDGSAWTCVDVRIANVPVGAVLLLYHRPASGGPAPEFRGFLRVRALRPSRWSLRGSVRAEAPTPPGVTASSWRVDRVTLAVRTLDGGREARVDGLGLSDAHPRPWTALPSDRALLGPRAPWRENPHAALWSDARRPRLAVAAPAPHAARYLPVGMVFGRDVTGAAWLPPGAALERDGLGAPSGEARVLSPAPFLDARLAGASASTLLDEADRLRDQALQEVSPTFVRGLHAVLGLAEVTLLAVPDAVWVGRALRRPARPPTPAVAPPKGPPPDPPDVGDFRRCGEALPPPPPAALPLPRPAEAPEGWRFDAAPATLATETVALQRQAVRLCAARGDMTVALSAPPELRAGGVSRHLAALRRGDGSLDGMDLAGSLWTRALSFATLHHPWLVARDGTPGAPVRAQCPDGAALGLIARRALARGAWIAPAWEPLRDVLALTPSLDDAEVASLLDARVNVIAREPRGAMPLDALTLSDDVDYTQLSVRRLMILLRRAALERGERYVFEPLSGALQRAASLGFDSLLGSLFDRGAFAGATRAEAFRVAVLEATGDDGRIVIELRVAPSMPLRFLTVRLLQRGDALAAAEERAADG